MKAHRPLRVVGFFLDIGYTNLPLGLIITRRSKSVAADSSESYHRPLATMNRTARLESRMPEIRPYDSEGGGVETLPTHGLTT